MAGYKYTVAYAPTGRARCRKCAQTIALGDVRITRESGPIAQFNDHTIVSHFHYKHAFEAMRRAMCKSKVIMTPKDLIGLSKLKPRDRQAVSRQITTFSRTRKTHCKTAKVLRSKSKRSKSRLKSKLRSRSRSRRTRAVLEFMVQWSTPLMELDDTNASRLSSCFTESIVKFVI